MRYVNDSIMFNALFGFLHFVLFRCSIILHNRLQPYIAASLILTINSYVFCKSRIFSGFFKNVVSTRI